MQTRLDDYGIATREESGIRHPSLAVLGAMLAIAIVITAIGAHHHPATTIGHAQHSAGRPESRSLAGDTRAAEDEPLRRAEDEPARPTAVGPL